MFYKDFHLLNEIYDQKIVNENLGLGPKADNEGISPTPIRIVKASIPPKRSCGGDEQEEHCAYAAKGCKCNKCAECEANQTNNKSEDCEGYDPSTSDSNGEMSRQLLFRIHKISAMLHDILQGKNNIEAWVLSKITNAHDQLDSVFGYEDYEAAKNPQHGMCGADNFEESNEEELYSAIARGGDELIRNLNNALKKESTETVEKVLLETILILEKKKKLA